MQQNQLKFMFDKVEKLLEQKEVLLKVKKLYQLER